MARTFVHTSRALQEYYNSAPARTAAWDAVRAAPAGRVDRAFRRYRELCVDHVAAVQEAFYLDTADINSRDKCELVGIGDIERVVAS